VSVFSFDGLGAADLFVDAVYEGARRGNAGDDPLPSLLAVSNQGGFRYRGTLQQPDLVVLTSSLADVDWPDSLDPETGVFTYYGDNKKPGRSLHDTPRHGNELLRRLFDSAQARSGRSGVPPILVFANTGTWRDVRFLGLAVPGSLDPHLSEDLVAIWKNVAGRRFQNYRARFTVLDVPVISRNWITDIIAGNARSQNAPKLWLDWSSEAEPTPLLAARSVSYRTKLEQLPANAAGQRVLKTIHGYFAGRPHDFEPCAAAIARMSIPGITSHDLTRPSRDGGRDAIGEYRIGAGVTSIVLRFCLEAKCYAMTNGVGVRQMSRLISRLRHRDFGILVTTSYVDLQTYREIREDAHPIVVIAGADIVDLLRTHGYADADGVLMWLRQNFPPGSRPHGI